ncbi:MAG: DUF401 family protein, partial [Planctomycetes bacterium]|nr:DUF401 family protein [Planctomycetota bacterium]
FSLISPIVVVIATYAVIRICFPQVAEVSRYLPISIGVCAAMLLVQCQRRLSREEWKEIVFSKNILNLLILVAVIRIYGAFIEAELPSGETMGAAMRAEMITWSIPALMIIAIIPFISGLSTGIAVGFVGAGMPVVISVLGGSDATLAEKLPAIMLAYACGFVGMMLSPLHVCLVVTNTFFKTRIHHSIGILVRPSIVIILWALAFYFILQAWLG